MTYGKTANWYSDLKNAELEEGIVSMCRATKYCDTLQFKVVCYKVMHDAMLNAIV